MQRTASNSGWPPPRASPRSDVRSSPGLPTSHGEGDHDLAFSDNSRFVFAPTKRWHRVGRRDRHARQWATTKVGSRPVSIAWSTQAKAAYVANAGDGGVVAVGPDRPEPLARIAAGRGSPRFASAPRPSRFVAIPTRTPSTHRRREQPLIQTADVEKEHDQVTSATSSHTSATAAARAC